MTASTNLVEIPSAVEKHFQHLYESFGGEILYLGDYQGEEAYLFSFPEGMCTGFPIVALYQKETGHVRRVPGDGGLDIIMEMRRKNER